MANWKVIALVGGNIEAVSGPAAQDRPGPTNGLSGKGKPLTKLKLSKMQRKPIPGLTWSGCAFAPRESTPDFSASPAPLSETPPPRYRPRCFRSAASRASGGEWRFGKGQFHPM